MLEPIDNQIRRLMPRTPPELSAEFSERLSARLPQPRLNGGLRRWMLAYGVFALLLSVASMLAEHMNGWLIVAFVLIPIGGCARFAWCHLGGG